jgi:hypothetical protein
MPVVGAASFALLAAVGWARGAGLAAFALTMGASLLMLWALASWLTSPGAQSVHWLRRGGINLEATGDLEPRVWLVAHLDCKSQRYPLAVRAAGAALSIAAWSAVALELVASATWHAHWPFTPVLALAAVGGLLLGLGAAGNESPGAVDNASGVATVMAAAASLGPASGVGVLITDAEEVGLAGAHAWTRGRSPGVAINCDTVDDTGTFRRLTAGPGSRAIVVAARSAAKASGLACRSHRTPAGVLTDGTALARAGWDCATLSRATPGTLMRIHTPRDCVGSFEGTSIAPAAAFLVATVQELL